MEPFIGEIRLFAGSYEPAGWAPCDGRLLPVSRHTALFSILENRYGGDGRTSFALPDLRGRVPLHRGSGGRLTDRPLGSSGGAETVTLKLEQMPTHRHVPMCALSPAGTSDPSGAVWATGVGAGNAFYRFGTPSIPMSSQALLGEGRDALHNNMQPYLVVQFIIALEGQYPTRS